jgi:phage terminase Nu1 subunit (DNA packaging protein)
MLVNIDTLTKLTGSTRRTILNKCHELTRVQGKGREHLFESKDALPLIIANRRPDDKTLESERTRLASAQAEKTELEVEVIKGRLIPAENVEAVVNNMVSSFRAKMLSLPTKAAPSVVQLADVAEAETLLRDYVYEALTELSNYESEQYSTQDDKQSGKTGRATSDTNSKPVGGQQKKAVKGGKRRTRTVEH